MTCVCSPTNPIRQGRSALVVAAQRKELQTRTVPKILIYAGARKRAVKWFGKTGIVWAPYAGRAHTAFTRSELPRATVKIALA